MIEHDILRATSDRCGAMVENANSLGPRVRHNFLHSVGQHKHEHCFEALRNKQLNVDGLLEEVSLSIDQYQAKILLQICSFFLHVAIEFVEDFRFVGDRNTHAAMKGGATAS